MANKALKASEILQSSLDMYNFMRMFNFDVHPYPIYNATHGNIILHVVLVAV